MLSKIVCLLAIVGLFSLASSQSCGIQGENGTFPITLESVKETLAGGMIIASLPIYNINTTAAIASPHIRYLKVLRYISQYEIQCAEPFPEFVQTERTEVLKRDVIFTCLDNTKVQYTILIPVVDENTEPPVFAAAEYNATVVASANGSLISINAEIYVTDADVNKSNADLSLRCSNPRVVPLRVEIASNSSHLFRYDLMVPGDGMEPGCYEMILTADDGKHADSAKLNLCVEPGEKGQLQ